MDKKEAIKKAVNEAFSIAAEGYKAAFNDEASHDKLRWGFDRSRLAPVAAEIYKQLTQVVIVNIADGTISDMEQVRNLLDDMGYEGIVTCGDISIRFPERKTIEVEVEKTEKSEES